MFNCKFCKKKIVILVKYSALVLLLLMVSVLLNPHYVMRIFSVFMKDYSYSVQLMSLSL